MGKKKKELTYLGQYMGQDLYMDGGEDGIIPQFFKRHMDSNYQLSCESEKIGSEVNLLKEELKLLRNRSLWDRIINRDIKVYYSENLGN